MRHSFPFLPRFLVLCLIVLTVPFALAPAVHADDTFIESDEYTEDEEITNVFLQDDDYRIMIENLERNGQDFDWGWALTPGWQGADAEPAEEPQEEKKGFFRRRGGNRGGPELVQEPKEARLRHPELRHHRHLLGRELLRPDVRR